VVKNIAYGTDLLEGTGPSFKGRHRKGALLPGGKFKNSEDKRPKPSFLSQKGGKDIPFRLKRTEGGEKKKIAKKKKEET